MRYVRQRWRGLPVFWQFQLGGWLVFIAGVTLFKALMLNDAPLAAVSTLIQEPVGFLLTVALYHYYRRLPNALPSRLVVLRVVAACVLATIVDLVWFQSIRLLAFEHHEFVVSGNRGPLAIGVFRFMIYICWSLLYFWIKAALANLAAISAANAAQLQALRAQLNPHFLFNALNSIIAETDDNPRAAKALAHELASYLRYSLAHRHTENVTLAAEIEAMEHYLNVEKARFEERLSFSIDATPDARAALVPGFFLQPLVENAVKHGLHTSPGAMRILIRAACTDGRLRIEVGNTGEWRKAYQPEGHSGFGLESIKKRLALLFPDRHKFDIEHGQGWVNVTLEVPRA